MIRIVKKLLRSIVYFFYIFFSSKSFNRFNVIFNQFYSLYKSNEFKNIGSCYVQFPIYLHGGKFITIGDNFECDQRLRLDAYDTYLGSKFNPEIIIGNNVSIQKDCHIGAINKIVLGNNVLLASKVYISDHSHGEINIKALKLPPAQRKLYSKGPVIIEDNVWLGEGVVVLPNVTIGENTIVGANSVVTKSFPKNTVIAGNPARIIKKII